MPNGNNNSGNEYFNAMQTKNNNQGRNVSRQNNAAASMANKMAMFSKTNANKNRPSQARMVGTLAEIKLLCFQKQMQIKIDHHKLMVGTLAEIELLCFQKQIRIQHIFIILQKDHHQM